VEDPRADERPARLIEICESRDPTVRPRCGVQDGPSASPQEG
jgi:hypothetical protein